MSFGWRFFAVCGVLIPALMTPRPGVAQWRSSQDDHATLVAADGRPATGVTVYWIEPFLTRSAFLAGTPDAHGGIRFPSEGEGMIIAPPGGPLTFAVAKAGTIRLGDGTRITLRFVDEKGKALPDARITLYPTEDKAPITDTVIGGDPPSMPEALQGRLSRRTDAQGAVTFDGLPQGGRVSVTIQPSPNGRALALAGGITLSGSPVSPPQTIRLSFTGTVTGRVYYRAPGKPVPGARVMLIGPGYHNFMGEARADSAGRYRFQRLCPGQYNVSMQDRSVLQKIGPAHDDYLYTVRPHPQGAKWLGPSDCPTALVSERKATPDIDFLLVKTALVSGRVMGAHGRPISHAQVMMNYPDSGGSFIETDRAGRFRFRSPPANIRISWCLGVDQPERQTRSITLAEGESRTVIFSPHR